MSFALVLLIIMSYTLIAFSMWVAIILNPLALFFPFIYEGKRT